MGKYETKNKFSRSEIIDFNSCFRNEWNSTDAFCQSILLKKSLVQPHHSIVRFFLSVPSSMVLPKR